VCAHYPKILTKSPLSRNICIRSLAGWGDGMKNNTSNWVKFKMLWRVIPKDCREALIWEFIFNPVALHQRWQEEVNFRRIFDSHWDLKR